MPTSTLVDSPSFKRILTRNILGPLVMSLVLVAIFVGVVSYLLRVNESLSALDSVIEDETRLMKRLVDAETGIRGYLLVGSEEFLHPYTNALPVIPTLVEGIRSSFSGRPNQVARINEVSRVFDVWNSEAQKSIRERRRGQYRPGDGSNLRKDAMDSIRRNMDEMQADTFRRRTSERELAQGQARLVLAVSALITLILGGLLALMGRRQLMALSGSYEASLLAQSQQNERLAQQAWIRTGQVRLAEKIKLSLDASAISRDTLTLVADYTGASIGALYERDGDKLERRATFAFPAAPGPHGLSFRMGEGLVGQAAVDRKQRVLQQLPENYPQVVSGTGQARLRHALIVPLQADGEVQGVLELGFLESIPARVTELTAEISEIAGGALRAAAYRLRLQQLLSESQQLTEELQTQQEELRVSNEELEERSRALQESQGRLESQHAELLQTNEQLEEQATMLEEQKRSLNEKNDALEEAGRTLEQRSREVESASRYKSEFLANMSHELRTPLNSSLILAKLLRDNPDGNLSSEQVEFANTIYGAGNDLLGLINDILDLSKVEAGKLEINPEKVPLPAMLEALDKTFKPLANQKKIRLNFKIEEGAPDAITTDRQRIEQILKNLLSNAVKFTSEGGVDVTVRAGRNETVEFVVKDSGVGIAPSQIALIFDAFYQGDGTTSRKFGGTGLGLSISRNLAGLLNGSITATSEPDVGSTFTLTLPVKYREKRAEAIPSPTAAGAASPTAATARPDKVAANAAPPPPLVPLFPDDRAELRAGDKKVLLIVEDDAQFARILFDLTHEIGLRCLVTSSIDEGYELARKHLPTAVLMDIRLPDGSGLALLDRLKHDPLTRHIPVHGMSVADYSREALHLGAAGFQLKRSDRDELKRNLAKIEERARSRVRRVLVVEDDPVQRKSVERLIASAGVEIVAAESGGEALRFLKEGVFDCMIIDLRLPDMTGFQLLEEMPTYSPSSLPPVIVYTGQSLSRADETQLSRYSKSIIIKGARSPERLLDEVTLFLHQAEAELPAEQQRMIRASRNRERAFEGRTILLADDDVRNIFALTSALELKGASVVIARNGREALERVQAEPPVDLVLMDVMMPEMDGLEATRRIRELKERGDVPIIAVTAKAMQDDYERCLQAGANDYLAKPVDVDKLVSLIRVWIPKAGVN